MLAVLAPVPPVSVLRPVAPPLKATLTSTMSSFREWMPSALTTHTHRKMVYTPVHNYYALSVTRVHVVYLNRGLILRIDNIILLKFHISMPVCTSI